MDGCGSDLLEVGCGAQVENRKVKRFLSKFGELPTVLCAGEVRGLEELFPTKRR